MGWSMDPGPCFVYVLFGIFSFILERLTFLYYANDQSDDVIYN